MSADYVPLDTILPPALAYDMGRAASARAATWTGEGWLRDRGFCDCFDEPLKLTEKHLKARDFRAVPGDKVRRLISEVR